MTYNLQYISPKMRHLLEPAIENTHFSSRKLGVRVFEHASIVPFYKWRECIGGIMDADGNMVADSRNAEWEELNAPENTTLSIVHKNAIFIGMLIGGFGHTYTDNLRKIWFLKSEIGKNLTHEEDIDIVYITDINQPLPVYAKQILQYAGFDISRCKHIQEKTQYDVIYLPDNSFYAESYGRCYTQEYLDSFYHIKQVISQMSFDIPTYDKIYLSRAHFSKLPWSRQEQGEEVVEDQFNRNGYKSIYPEDYSFAEQVYMIQHCSHLATTEGSIAHIVGFCRPQTNVTIVCKANYLNFHQVAMNQIGNVNVKYVQAHHSHKMGKEIPWYGPFYLCVTHYFENYLGYRIPHWPFWMRPSFWKYMRIVPRTQNFIKRKLGLIK